MSWRLEGLVQDLGAEITGDPQVAIEAVGYDSRQVAPGSLFVALRGASTDGHRYLAQAIENGAAALLVDAASDAVPSPAAASTTAPSIVRVADTRAALPHVAARFYHEPARELTLIGVTGTNGKTSSVRLIESILLHAGRSAGSLGTISTRYAGLEEPASLTTPESVELHAALRRMRDAGVDHVALEVSSHSLASGRVATLRFAVAAFTNLTQDHLDFHGDMAEYGRAKRRLFEPDLLAGAAVLPAADAWADTLREAAESGGRTVYTYTRGTKTSADVFTSEEHIDLAGCRFQLHTPAGSAAVQLALAGDFQIDNALVAAACGHALGVPVEQIAAGLGACPGVPGRLERVGAETPGAPAVFVDYAHTPDALDRVLARLRPLVAGRLICVFGCGGDRDRTKRAPMARAACRHSDWILATSDNPRTEDPAHILADVAVGLSGEHAIVPDRREAISQAIGGARADDVVLIAGKGHETYQILGRERHPFDDRVEARAALARRGRAACS